MGYSMYFLRNNNGVFWPRRSDPDESILSVYSHYNIGLLRNIPRARLQKQESKYGITPRRESFGSSKARVSCQFLHLAQTEDIELKSSKGRKEGISLSTGRKL